MLRASQEAIESFVDDVDLLWCVKTTSCNSREEDAAAVDVLEGPPAALEFLRDHVSVSRPCIVRNVLPVEDATATTTTGKTNNNNNTIADLSTVAAAVGTVRITLDDLVRRAPADLTLTVDVTPDGHGDCIRQVTTIETSESVFVQPAKESSMNLEAFRSRLRASSSSADKKPPPPKLYSQVQGRVFPALDETNSDLDPKTRPGPCLFRDKSNTNPDAVLYYSRQNDCLRTELAELWEDLNLPSTFPWAERAFGTGPPDAVNLWIGNERAVSSMHKDHYQNLFYVASGEKVFTLCPPADAPFLYEQEFPSGTFAQTPNTNEWGVVIATASEAKEDRVRWIAADVTQRDNPAYAAQYPLLRYTHPVEIRVQEGEMLYLPALWFHRVTQSCETIGINYWYDMKFDSPDWCYFHFLQQLK
jgi:Cupin-like domain